MKQFLTFILIALLMVSANAQRSRKRSVPNAKSSEVSSSCIGDTSHVIKQGPYHYISDIQTIEGSYDKDMRVGLWSFKSDELAWSGEFQADTMIGRWVYTQNNIVISVLNIADGIAYSADTGYYEPRDSKSGPIRSIIEHYPNGLVITHRFYESGQLMELDSTFSIPSIQINRRFSEKGTLTYHVEKRDGYFWTIFPCEGDSSSKKYIEGDLSDGNGEVTVYKRNSETNQLDLVYHCNMRDGKLDGPFMMFDFSTQYTGNFKKGYLSGTWTKKTPFETLDHTYYLSDSLSSDTIHLLIDDFRYGVFNIVGRMPSFPGGEGKLFEYLRNTLYYPQQAREQGIQGRVYTKFEVDQTGMLHGFEILKSIHPCLDNESLRVMKLMPVWNPGFADGFPVKVKFSMPVNFVLQTH